jgi:hypothetical protein
MVIDNYSIICYIQFVYKKGDKCEFSENGSYIKLQEFMGLRQWNMSVFIEIDFYLQAEDSKDRYLKSLVSYFFN